MAEARGISEAVLLAVASALSYAVAYAYRAGFASHFGLPPLLLTPTIGAVLQAAAAVGFVVLLTWDIAAIFAWAPGAETAIGRAMRRMLVFTLICAPLMFINRDEEKMLFIFSVALCFAVFLKFVLPLMTQHKIAGYENKLLAQEKVEAYVRQFSLVGHTVGTFGENALVGLALGLLFLAYSLGYRTAKNQEEFFVLLDRPEHVVAAMDDNLIVLAAYDPATLALKGAYRVERLTGSQAWVLRQEHIGKLSSHPKPRASSPP